MKKSGIKATTLRTIMSITIFLVIGFSVFGFYYIQSYLLRPYALLAGQSVAKSQVNNGSAKETKDLQADIAKRKPAADLANSILVPSPDFQGQIVKDLNKYASDTGMTITDYSFAQSTIIKQKMPTLVGGANLSYITITLKNPVKFTSFIQFLKSIESNIPKMQLSGVSLNGTQSSTDSITVDPLIIGMYTK